MRFREKSVVVTGGATGIGYAIARRFAEEGARVTIVGRREDVGLKAQQEMQHLGLDVTFARGDVSDENEVRHLVKQTIERHGRLDILINNAALFSPMKFTDNDSSSWRNVFDVILNGTYYCSRIAAQHMIEAKIQGHIINVSSINAYRALEYSSHYNAAKGALDQLTRCMALELAEHGIRVNGVAPGFIETPMSLVGGEKEFETEWFQDIYVKRKKIPLQRQGQPNEISGLVAFLASEDASYICGITIPADGGLSITF